jgi:SNF2 family DNA or RNA helicase
MLVKNTVDERILALQQKKKAISDAALGDVDAERLGKLSIRELVGLFGTLRSDGRGGMRLEE